MTPASCPSRSRTRFGCGSQSGPANSGLGGQASSTTASSAVVAIIFPVRTKNGTPAHRHESMFSRNAANVSVDELAATPGSSR